MADGQKHQKELFMKLKSLQRITKSLEKVFEELERCGVQDRHIRHRYAEFAVASELTKRGHTVQLLSDREDKTADIYLPDTKKRVEVKSSKPDGDNWAYASFGKGTQIGGDKFDYCVFVIFAAKDETVQEMFVLTKGELNEVKECRTGVARYETTNPCGLMYAPSLKEFEDWVRENKIKAWSIERRLRKHPEKFRNRWSKIK